MSETLPTKWAPELDGIARLGQWLAASEVERPNEKQQGAAAALRIYFARELGLSPLAASELSVIRGRLVVSAKLLRARAAQYGYRVVKVEGTDKTCTAALIERDSGELAGEYTFTIEDARKAGLVKEKSGWERYPARMLWARASKYVIDDNAPEASLGLVLEDEAAEITGEVVAESFEEDEKPEGPAPVASGGHGASYEPDPPGPIDEAEEVRASIDFVAPEGERGSGANE